MQTGTNTTQAINSGKPALNWFSVDGFQAFTGEKQASQEAMDVLHIMHGMCEDAYARGYAAALNDQKQAT